MPAVQPPATVLVTGVTGFSGVWIARALLENGYAVRGTVRSEQKAAHIAAVFKAHGDRFTTVVVPDIARADAFDGVLDDSISAVVHIAGVAELSDNPDPGAILGPNTDSVVNLLESMRRHGKNVKRFIYMSSAQAMLGHEDIFHVYTEDDWANKDLALVNEKGSAAGGQALYRASKVLAERAVVDFVEEHKSEIGWDATRILPAWIFGVCSEVFCSCSINSWSRSSILSLHAFDPRTPQWKTIDDLNLSSKIMYRQLTTPRDEDRVNDYASEYIDVRDVADAFVAALQIEAAGDERFILDAGAYTYQNLYDAVYATAPDLEGVVRGNPSAPPFVFPGPFCDSSKAKCVLKLKEFRNLGECAVDTFKSVQARAGNCQ